MNSDLTEPLDVTTNQPEAPWETLHSATLEIIRRIQSRQPIIPATLNPMYAAIVAESLAWTEEQRLRARADLHCAEVSLAHRQPLTAMHALLLLQRRLEREGVQAASNRRYTAANATGHCCPTQMPT